VKKSKTKNIILITIAALLFIAISALVLFGTSMTVSYKAAYVSFTEENGVITEVKLGGPFAHNIVEVTSDSETVYDENGNAAQIITTYEGSVKQSLIFSKEQTITIEVSDTVEYIYLFNFNETIIIKNGILVDWLQSNTGKRRL